MIRLATVFSGIGAIEHALQRMQIRNEIVFACDNGDINLDIDDVDFENRECIVFGKGDKERKVYFDAKTKIHLKNYIATRTDNNPCPS